MGIKQRDREWYDEKFSASRNNTKLREKALKQALDIRKFEIELYWKRATYFWAFLAAAFTGYFLVYRIEETPEYLLLLLSNLGFIFSFCWVLVNKGSKFWQNNWERHVDRLEDDDIGPLYKTVIYDEMIKKESLVKEYPFSVSKINQLLSIYITFLWLVLFCKDLYISLAGKDDWENHMSIDINMFPLFILIGTICFITLIWTRGESNLDSNEKVIISNREIDDNK